MKDSDYRAIIRILIKHLLNGEYIKGDPKWARVIADDIRLEIEKYRENNDR